MASIFPGMDPYLEGPATWPGLHASLIIGIKRYLQPHLLPKYYAEAGERLYIENAQHSIYPDVAIFKRSLAGIRETSSTVVADEPRVVYSDYQQREHFLEIREVSSNEVVSIIEVLSPSNKKPGANGRDLYLRKQQEVLASSVHLIEIDLLRDGVATVTAAPGRLLGKGHYDYVVCVSRSDRRGEIEVYTSCMQQRLPRPKIPLRPSDDDLTLDLTPVFVQCYEEGGYGYRLDYTAPPPAPKLIPEDEAWLDSLLSSAGLRA